jgi:pantoate--beta-alanine ligase
MGALHQGHLSLVDRAKRDSDCTVMSIFVNPLQFAPTEDLAKYPRPVEEDDRLAEDSGVDILFRPEVGEMYRDDRVIGVTAGDLASRFEGASRPGHFDGVLTVVAKLFNIVQPDLAVFWQKDLQQAALVKAMVRDLDMPLDIVVSRIVREEGGLAMSSRNRYLTEAQRENALALNRSLRAVKDLFTSGESDVSMLEAAGSEVLAAEDGVRADYIAVVNPETFLRPDVAGSSDAVIVAARVGTTRLIDNALLADDED